MATTLAPTSPRPAPRESLALRERRSPWWVEAGYLVVGYTVYAAIRNARGAAADEVRAAANARRVVAVERALGLSHEAALQHLALKAPWLVRADDSFYASAHFVVTAGVLVALYAFAAPRYREARLALGLTTALALVGFALFPLLPPRLLPSASGFVDTWRAVGGLGWSQAPRIERISDPYAAMPSLHLGWAMWCALAVRSTSRSPTVRRLAWAYPAVTLIVVVVTGNHFILDAGAGVAVAVGGWWLAAGVRRVRGRG